jgi:hypothetical protein
LLSSSELTRSNSRSRLRTSARSFASQGFDEGVLAVDALLQRLDLVLAPAGAAFELGNARALLLELLENQRELRAPIGEQAGQAISKALDGCSGFGHVKSTT